MTPSTIYSKSGKGVQEASGKTSILSRGDRAVLSAFDGRIPLSEVAERVGKGFDDAKFQALIGQLEKDGFIREVASSGAAAPAARPGPARPAPPRAPAGGGAPGEELDFTVGPPKKPAAPPAPPVDLAAKAREDADRKTKETEAVSYKSRQEAEARSKAEAEVRAKA